MLNQPVFPDEEIVDEEDYNLDAVQLTELNTDVMVDDL